MCVIIHKPAGIGFKEEDLRAAHKNNNHGFGYMYYDLNEKRIRVAKQIDLTEDKTVEHVNKLKDFNACFHYRWKTHGEINNAQCHPFRVLDKDKHGMDMFFMHNGVIRNTGNTDKESDTQAFNRNFLKPILKHGPDIIRTEAFKKLIEEFIGKGSKLCFMFGEGEVLKFNEEQGSAYENCWVSNTYSFSNGHRSSKVNNNTNFYNGSNYYGDTRQNNSCSYPKDTTKNAVTVVGKKETKKFIETDVSVGDTVYIWHHSDQEFFAEGTISELNATAAFVLFKDVNGKNERISFYLTDGESFLNKGSYYFAIPSKSWETAEEKNKTVKDEKKEKGLKVRKLTTKTSGKDTEHKPMETGGVKKEESPFIVSHDGLTADASDHYGGAFITGSDVGYSYTTDKGETLNVSFADIADMTYEDRFKFFVDQFDTAFNMWQDLCENITIQDQEFYDEMVEEEEERAAEQEEYYSELSH